MLVPFYNSSGCRIKLIFDIHSLTVVSTEAASAMVRCVDTNHATFLVLLSWSTVSCQEGSDQQEDQEEFDGHGFMVNLLVGLFVIKSRPW